MASAQRALSAKNSHLESLVSRHATIESELHELSRHLSASDTEIQRLKRQKLRIKEEIESLH